MRSTAAINQMGTSTSLMEICSEPVKSEQAGNDAIILQRSYACDVNSRTITRPVSTSCYDSEYELGLSSSLLPGQVEDIDLIAKELAYASISGDGGSSKSSEVYKTRNTCSIPHWSGFSYDSSGVRCQFRGNKGNARPVMSSFELQMKKNKFPVLSVCERPKKVKTAMLESLLVAVPALRRVNSKEEKRNKSKIGKAESKAPENSGTENEEAPDEFVLNHVYVFDKINGFRENSEVEGGDGCHNFHSKMLFQEEIACFDQQRVLSRVEDIPEEQL